MFAEMLHNSDEKIFLEAIDQFFEQESSINYIEKDEKYFSYRLYRENAIIKNNNYYKDLSILGRDLKKITG